MGYRHFRGTDPEDTDDWSTLTLINCLEAVGRESSKARMRLNVTDLSRERGGRFPPHASHQNGVDVDVRYVRRDRANAPLDLQISPEDYDQAQTAKLIGLFLDLCPIEAIFLDEDGVGFELEDVRLQHANGHSNHFHVRVREPADG